MDHFKDRGIILKTRGGSFSDDTLDLKVEFKIKNEDGTIQVSNDRHFEADAFAKEAGIKVEGHFIGSVWSVNNKIYIVDSISLRSRKFPVKVKEYSDDMMGKVTVAFLNRGVQILKPTRIEFIKWFTLDPDSDAIRESDAEICDNVQAYMNYKYPDEDGDKYLGMVDNFNEKGIARTYASTAYNDLIRDDIGIQQAYINLKNIWKKVTRK